MRRFLFPSTLLVCLLAPSHSVLSDQAILIGGGYNINSSQEKTELNVKWVQDILEKSGLPVSTFFNDGDNASPDVHYLPSVTDNTDLSIIDTLSTQLEPIARLFNDHDINRQRYRNHSVNDVRGPTNASQLTQALDNLISSAPNDPSLIVYNGHGKQSNSIPDKVTLELWGDTQITANELHAVLAKSNAPSRFIFGQCYSGGFHRLAYANPESGLELASNTRCGFTAESAYQLAEACTASINNDDYRDYTSYFFAALDGYDKHGEILGEDTDANGNGEVSLREAHLYTLKNAHSIDLSRSTSEDFLDRWQPWYLKWLSAKQGLPNNEYAKLYRALADRHNIALDDNPSKSIRNRLNAYKETAQSLKDKRKVLRIELQAVQNQIIDEMSKQWPTVTSPYTGVFQAMAASGTLVTISNWIQQQSGYKKIVELQTEDANIDTAMLDAERNATQMQKLFHFRKLANLKHQLYQYGSQSHIQSYEKLVSCESKPLTFSDKQIFAEDDH